MIHDYQLDWMCEKLELSWSRQENDNWIVFARKKSEENKILYDLELCFGDHPPNELKFWLKEQSLIDHKIESVEMVLRTHFSLIP